MGMHATNWFLAICLLGPALAGCIAGDPEPAQGLPQIGDDSFTVGSFVTDLETATDASLVNARVESLSIDVNRSEVTSVEWRSFAQGDGGCELVATTTYEGDTGTGGYKVHKHGQPCPSHLEGRPTVAEVVALVDRTPPAMLRGAVLDDAERFSVSLAGYCSLHDDGGQEAYRWDGAGVTREDGSVVCGGGTGSALTLAVNVPTRTAQRPSPATYVLLEQVPIQ